MVEASSPDRQGVLDAQLTERIADYRRLREQIERGIAPLATSVESCRRRRTSR